MSRPQFYRDPVHGQIRFEAIDLDSSFPSEGSSDAQVSWLIRKLIDTPEFQRLRHIRQNGLTNYVFHGAEHSRFAHSVGVSHLARRMYDAIVRNTGDDPGKEVRLATIAAALLHDVGHGPFSHLLEEVLKDSGVDFDHEVMTRRYLLDTGSSIHSLLSQVHVDFPKKVAEYIDKDNRETDHWSHKIVSSQLDADRLDYLLRDSRMAGLEGHGFDLSRLVDMLGTVDDSRIGVNRRGLEAVEAYLVMLDQMYRAVYYHHAVRSASILLVSVLRRVKEVQGADPSWLFTKDAPSSRFAELLAKGSAIGLESYSGIWEAHVWVLMEHWATQTEDPLLADLAGRLVNRRYFKTLEVDPTQMASVMEKIERARALAVELESLCETVDAAKAYFVSTDEPSRTSYKRYDWLGTKPDESIFILEDDGSHFLIEDYPRSNIAQGLKATKYFHRLVVPASVRLAL